MRKSLSLLGFLTGLLVPSLTFAAFVTGEANVLACNAAQRMAATEQPQTAESLPV